MDVSFSSAQWTKCWNKCQETLCLLPNIVYEVLYEVDTPVMKSRTMTMSEMLHEEPSCDCLGKCVLTVCIDHQNPWLHCSIVSITSTFTKLFVQKHWWNVIMRPKATEIRGKINWSPACLQSTIKTGKDPFASRIELSTRQMTESSCSTTVWKTEERLKQAGNASSCLPTNGQTAASHSW